MLSAIISRDLKEQALDCISQYIYASGKEPTESDRMVTDLAPYLVEYVRVVLDIPVGRLTPLVAERQWTLKEVTPMGYHLEGECLAQVDSALIIPHEQILGAMFQVVDTEFLESIEKEINAANHVEGGDVEDVDGRQEYAPGAYRKGEICEDD